MKLRAVSGRSWLRRAGFGVFGLAIALDLGLLATGNPGALPGPLGPMMDRHLVPWMQDVLMPLVPGGKVSGAPASSVEPSVNADKPASPSPAREAIATDTPTPRPTASATVTPLATASPTQRAEASPTPTPTPVAPVANPAEISAPEIGLDAPVIHVGVTADGAMQTPRTEYEVGWYGPAPGAAGNAILTGHVDWLVSGRPVRGAFYFLYELNPGDVITVTAADGAAHRFRVIWKQSYEASSAPVEDIAGPTSVPSITLITCGGEFDRALREYADRWVVRAILIRQGGANTTKQPTKQ
ncbi:MAG: class F sortase [Chloroflexota bacterium]